MTQRTLLAAAFVSAIATSSYAAQPPAKALEDVLLPAGEYREEVRRDMHDDVTRVGRDEVRRCWMFAGGILASLNSWEVYRNCVDSASPLGRRGRE